MVGVSFLDKSFLYYVRAVREGQCGSLDNFVDNGDGTVSDTDTGLMWQKDTAPGTYTWQQALSYCETSTLAGYNDWRLPNVNELHSIVDYSRQLPTINTTYFPNTVSSYYWSSTTLVSYTDSARVVDFYYGYVSDNYKSLGSYVRAVRGQCGSLDTSTTTTISGSTTTSVHPCPTETLYGEHSEETETLRYFRDNIMSQTPEGQKFIKLYYELSPVIVKAMKENEEFNEQIKEMIDGVLELIRNGVN